MIALDANGLMMSTTTYAAAVAFSALCIPTCIVSTVIGVVQAVREHAK